MNRNSQKSQKRDGIGNAFGTEEDTEQITEVSELYYSYHCLDETQKKIYLEILDALANMKKDALLSIMDKSGVDLIFACVMNDHPELFMWRAISIQNTHLEM